MSGGFVKLYGSIVASSIWASPLATRVVWITMLALADQEGFIEGSVGGLARLANVSRDECVAALAELSSPDPDSKTPDNEGRRIAENGRGWTVLNYTLYREMRTRSQDDAARRKRVQRERERGLGSESGSDGSVTVTEVTDASASASASGGSLLGGMQGGEHDAPVNADILAFVGDNDFGPFGDAVVGLLKSQRQPAAVLSTLKLYLQGELGHEKCSARELGFACQQYLPSADRWNSAYFAGFVRRSKGKIATAREADFIASEAKEKIARDAADQRARDEAKAERKRLIAAFSSDKPARYRELADLADADVPADFKKGRSMLIDGRLLELIEAEISGIAPRKFSDRM